MGFDLHKDAVLGNRSKVHGLLDPTHHTDSPPATGKQGRPIGDESWFGKSLAVSPDGRLLAVGCADNKVRLFDIESGGLLLRLDERPSFGARAFPATNRPTRSRSAR